MVFSKSLCVTPVTETVTYKKILLVDLRLEGGGVNSLFDHAVDCIVTLAIQ
jgi:hypothetical protein